MLIYVSLRMSARSRRIQFVAAVLKQWLVGGRYRAIGEYTTALLLGRTTTTGKRGGRQGQSTTWVESFSVNVGLWVSPGGWGLERFGLREAREENKGALEAEAESGTVNRGGESRPVVQRDNTPTLMYTSETCRFSWPPPNIIPAFPLKKPWTH